MSDSEEQQIEDQESEEEQQSQEEQEEEEDGSDEEQDEDEDQDGDEDEDEDEDQDEDSNQSGSGEQESDQDESKQNEESQQVQKFVPTFKPVSQEFVFKNLLADIASIGNSVDHFISSLSSTGGSGYRSQSRSYAQRSYEFKEITPVEEKKYTIMKDEDTQVSMQPQIVIQQTVVPNQQPKQQAYKISNESTKFLSKLYEENKKLKKFQNSQTGGLGTNIWSKSQERFSRPEHERGLINLQDRNKEIDEAIQMLRREEYEN